MPVSTFTPPNEQREQIVPPPPRHPFRRLRDDDPPRYARPVHRSRLPVWLAILILASALIASGWYGLTLLNEQGIRLGALDGWGEQLTAFKNRLVETEKRLSALPADLKSIRDRMSGLDRKLTAGLEQARRRADDLNNSLRDEIRGDLQGAKDAQAQALETRFRELQAARESDAGRMGQLEKDVAQLNQQLAGVRQDLGGVPESIARETRQIRQEIRTTDGRVTQLATFNDRPRERFEISRGRTQEIAPNILLHVNSVNPRNQSFRGWLKLDNNGNTVSLRDQGAFQTMAFYAGSKALRHELVVTGLTRDKISGYLILPSIGESGSGEAAPEAGVPKRVESQ